MRQRNFIFYFTDIGAATFVGCKNLKNVDMIKAVNLITIGTGSFAGCSAMETFVIPEAVVTLNAYAFYGYDKLTIYSYQSEALAGWNADWNKSSRPVVWNY